MGHQHNQGAGILGIRYAWGVAPPPPAPAPVATLRLRPPTPHFTCVFFGLG